LPSGAVALGRTPCGEAAAARPAFRGSASAPTPRPWHPWPRRQPGRLRMCHSRHSHPLRHARRAAHRDRHRCHPAALPQCCTTRVQREVPSPLS